jgi:hypothetical protein
LDYVGAGEEVVEQIQRRLVALPNWHHSAFHTDHVADGNLVLRRVQCRQPIGSACLQCPNVIKIVDENNVSVRPRRAQAATGARRRSAQRGGGANGGFVDAARDGMIMRSSEMSRTVGWRWRVPTVGQPIAKLFGRWLRVVGQALQDVLQIRKNIDAVPMTT